MKIFILLSVALAATAVSATGTCGCSMCQGAKLKEVHPSEHKYGCKVKVFTKDCGCECQRALPYRVEVPTRKEMKLKTYGVDVYTVEKPKETTKYIYNTKIVRPKEKGYETFSYPIKVQKKKSQEKPKYIFNTKVEVPVEGKLKFKNLATKLDRIVLPCKECPPPCHQPKSHSEEIIEEEVSKEECAGKIKTKKTVTPIDISSEESIEVIEKVKRKPGIHKTIVKEEQGIESWEESNEKIVVEDKIKYVKIPKPQKKEQVVVKEEESYEDKSIEEEEDYHTKKVVSPKKIVEDSHESYEKFVSEEKIYYQPKKVVQPKKIVDEDVYEEDEDYSYKKIDYQPKKVVQTKKNYEDSHENYEKFVSEEIYYPKKVVQPKKIVDDSYEDVYKKYEEEIYYPKKVAQPKKIAEDYSYEEVYYPKKVAQPKKIAEDYSYEEIYYPKKVHPKIVKYEEDYEEPTKYIQEPVEVLRHDVEEKYETLEVQMDKLIPKGKDIKYHQKNDAHVDEEDIPVPTKKTMEPVPTKKIRYVTAGKKPIAVVQEEDFDKLDIHDFDMNGEYVKITTPKKRNIPGAVHECGEVIIDDEVDHDTQIKEGCEVISPKKEIKKVKNVVIEKEEKPVKKIEEKVIKPKKTIEEVEDSHEERVKFVKKVDEPVEKLVGNKKYY